MPSFKAADAAHLAGLPVTAVLAWSDDGSVLYSRGEVRGKKKRGAIRSGGIQSLTHPLSPHHLFVRRPPPTPRPWTRPRPPATAPCATASSSRERATKPTAMKRTTRAPRPPPWSMAGPRRPPRATQRPSRGPHFFGCRAWAARCACGGRRASVRASFPRCGRLQRPASGWSRRDGVVLCFVDCVKRGRAAFSGWW